MIMSVLLVANSVEEVAEPGLVSMPTWLSFLLIVLAGALTVALALFLLNVLRDKPRGLIPISRVSLAGMSILIGLVMSILCAYVGHHDLLQDTIAGVVVAILVVQVGEVFRHEGTADKVASLERAMEDNESYKKIVFQLDQFAAIEAVLSQHPKLKNFTEEVIEQTYAQLNAKLEALGKGQIVIDQGHRELTSNKHFLLALPNEFVHAVSYEDETFWDEPAGQDFLDAHKVLLRQGKRVKRIFILKEAESKGQSSVIKVQVDLGIDCWIIIEEHLDSQFRRDFVLYDDKYVRYGETLMHGRENVLKRATLLSQAVAVEEFAEKFAFLEANSIVASKFFASEWSAPSATTRPDPSGPTPAI